MPETVTVLLVFSYGGGKWKRACDWGLGPEIPLELGASGHEGCAKPWLDGEPQTWTMRATRSGL